MTVRFAKKALVAAAMLPLAACIRFGDDPPPSLLTLAPASQPAPGQAQNTAQERAIVIQVPAAPQALSGTRVPVQASDTSIAYVKDAQWAEPPARLFARLLADTVTARSGYVVLTPSQSVGEPGATLGGDLRSFGLDAAQRQAVVVFDAAVTGAEQHNVQKRRFEARVPIAAVSATTAGPAISQAANQVAVEVADWVRTLR